jgi:hypothetical protein
VKTILCIAITALLLTPTFDVNAKKPKKPKGAQLEFDQDVTPTVGGTVIFGNGNSNGFFTTGRKRGVEVGLRAKIRFPASANPDGTISNGDGTYNLPAGARSGSFAHRLTALWSFDWTVNTDYLSSSGMKLSDFVYELGMDSDPSSKTSYTSFDPISTSLLVPCWDHAMGDNSTEETLPPPTGDRNVSPCLSYASDLELSNVAQQSWRYDFFVGLGTSLEFFDPSVPGEYTIFLKVKDPVKGKTVAESKILVLVTL